jgi:cyclophilin family peptidyl-prolyl cis-trans isomerase
MFRTALLFVLTAALGAGAAFAQEHTTADEAKQSFDQLRSQWQTTIGQLQEKLKAKTTDGGSETLDQELAALQQQSEELVKQIVTAGLDVYRADPKGYPTVNETLVAIAGFYVMGDPSGDGGDQYERALPIIEALLKGGAGANWQELWVWGGVSAFCTNDFGLAERYLKHASMVGLFENLPRRPTDDPAMRTRQYGLSCLNDLESARRAWEKEEKIRAAEAEADDLPRVKLTTTRGDIVVELFENEAPQSVANFITLAKQGFYNDVPFHRVLPGFMAQGGDPRGTGAGGPGYTIRDEQGQPNQRQHFRGSLSMANTGAPNSGGSQFFLTFVPTSFLDGRHAVFGRVIEGMDIAAALKRRDPDSARPPTPDKIITATVLRDRGHDYEFEKLPE